MKNLLLVAAMIGSVTTVYASDFKCEATLQEGAAKKITVQLQDVRGALLGNINGFAFGAQVAPDNSSVISVSILDQNEGRTASTIHAPLPTADAPVQVDTFFSGGKTSVYCTAN